MDLGIDIFSKFVATCSKFHQLLQKTENKLHNVQFRHTTSIRSTTHIWSHWQVHVVEGRQPMTQATLLTTMHLTSQTPNFITIFIDIEVSSIKKKFENNAPTMCNFKDSNH